MGFEPTIQILFLYKDLANLRFQPLSHFSNKKIKFYFLDFFKTFFRLSTSVFLFIKEKIAFLDFVIEYIPATRSRTATLLRLHPNHQSLNRSIFKVNT
jgi:hypothetical protein